MTVGTVTIPLRGGPNATTDMLSASANAVTGDVSLSVTIEACPPNGTPVISGTVEFFEGASRVGSTPLHALTLFVLPPTTPCAVAQQRMGDAQITLRAVSPG